MLGVGVVQTATELVGPPLPEVPAEQVAVAPEALELPGI
jgi:hypothetical protein